METIDLKTSKAEARRRARAMVRELARMTTDGNEDNGVLRLVRAAITRRLKWSFWLITDASEPEIEGDDAPSSVDAPGA